MLRLAGTLSILSLGSVVVADVTRDGTIGPSTDVQPEGPNFLVTESMGELFATNLFHSFGEFSIDPNQSVTFTGRSSINNIIARITGGDVSNIFGLLRSDVAGSNVFLINPQGFVFGEGATVDVDGGLYVSSADVLEFSDGRDFKAQARSGPPVLSAASPAAFGFLSGDAPGAIQIIGSELEHEPGQTLAFIGGDLIIEGASIKAESGRVHLIAAGEGSRVPLQGPIELSSGANVSIIDSEIDVSGEPNGAIRLHAGALDVVDASISSTNEGEGPGASTGIEILVSGGLSILGESELSVSTEGDGNAGDIRVQAGDMLVAGEGQVISETEGAGRAGDVAITVDRLTLDGDAEIASDVESEGSGRGGSVIINARTIDIVGDAEISSDTDADSSGSGGSVTLTASESFRIEMDTEPGEEGGVFTNTEGSGDAGSIHIETPSLLVDGGVIFAGTNGDGTGGSIELLSKDVLVRDRGAVSAASDGDGDAGNIRLNGSGTLRLEADGRITTASELSDGGNIEIGGDYGLVDVIDSTVSANVGDGVGGNVDIGSDQIVLDRSSVVARAGDGQGGAITLTSQTFFSSESVVSASAGPAGISGTVAINAPDINLTGSLTPLPSNFLDAAQLIRSACRERRERGASTGGLNVEFPRGEPSTIEGLPARVEHDRSGIDSELARVLESSYRVRRAPDERPLGESLALLDELESAIERIDPASDQAYALIHLANTRTTLALTHPDEKRRAVLGGYSSLVRARAIARSTTDARAESFVEGNLAQLYASQGRIEDSLLLVQEAIELAERAEAPSALYRWHVLEGDLLWARGKAQASIEAYRRSVAILELIRHESIVLENVPSVGKFNADVAPVYLTLVGALLRASELVSEPESEQALLAEARATLEQFKSAELRNYFQDPCVTELQERSMSLDALAQSAAVVYPILLPDRLEILVTTETGIERHTVSVPGRQIATEVRRFRHALGDIGSTRYLRHAQNLYRWLVAPYVERLTSASIDTLVFVPDRALRSIPMSALHDGREYLIERFAIVTAPGLDLVDPQRLDRDGIRPLLAGVTVGIDDYAPLPNVEEELRNVSRMYESELLIDEEFVIGNLAAAFDANRPSVLHIASHAEFARSTDKSFVLTYEGRVPLDELISVVAAARFREEPLELLVLSACETAAGNDHAALGLAGLAVRAGARSVVGSLWAISDAAAANVFVEFYGKLGDADYTKAESLRYAQLELMRRPEFSHPFFWSPFLIINNWY